MHAQKTTQFKGLEIKLQYKGKFYKKMIFLSTLLFPTLTHQVVVTHPKSPVLWKLRIRMI